MPNKKYLKQLTLRDIDKRLSAIERKLGGEAQRKAEKFDMLRFLSIDLHMFVKSVKPILRKDGDIELEVEYEMPKMRIVNVDDEIQLDPRIVALNALDFIPFEDMQKISSAIQKYLKSKNIN